MFCIVDDMYEGQQKRTYMTMLIQVGLYLPLLVGLLLLYPWLAGSLKIQYSLENEEENKTYKLTSSKSNLSKKEENSR